MSYPTFPNYQTIGVAMQAQITAFNSGTGDFTFTTGGSSYNANWNTDVVANCINTISRAVGSSGRLNLSAAKAGALRLGGWKSAGSRYGTTDYATYTAYTATVRSASGSTVTLTIGGRDYSLDWGNPAAVWTGSETTIAPTTGSSGVARLGDAWGHSVGLTGGADKWPASLARRGTSSVRVRLDTPGVVIVDAAGQAVRDARGHVARFALTADTPGVYGLDPARSGVQVLDVSHELRARLALP